MGLTLCNKLVCNTYPGVLKTCDNAALTAAPKPMTDGVGNNVPIALGTACAIYTGTHDFTGATVTGITGAAGLVNGTGTDSMRSDITTIAACALGTCSIALGDGAYADGCNSIAIGKGATTLCAEGITMGFASSANGLAAVAIGRGATSTEYAVGLGYGASANGLRAVAIGFGTIGTGDCSVTIGCGSAARGTGSVAIGHDSETNTGVQDSVSIGRFNGVAHNQSVALGCCNFIGLICGTGTSNIGIGAVNCVEGNYNISIGSNNCAMNDCSIAIGRLSCVTNNFSIAMGNQSSASGACAIAMGNAALVTCNDGIAIGLSPQVTAFRAIAIGRETIASGNSNVAIGYLSQATGALNSFAIGNQAVSSAESAFAFGPVSRATCPYAISLGFAAGFQFGDATNGIYIGKCAGTVPTSTAAIAIGCNSGSGFVAPYAINLGVLTRATAACAIAIGYNVCANRANVLTTCELETCVAGCGLIVKTPNGLSSYRIAVDNSGNLTTTLV